MCAKNNNLYMRHEQAIRECSLLLLAATVRSFAHMPLGISDRNNTREFNLSHMPNPLDTNTIN